MTAQTQTVEKTVAKAVITVEVVAMIAEKAAVTIAEKAVATIAENKLCFSLIVTMQNH